MTKRIFIIAVLLIIISNMTVSSQNSRLGVIVGFDIANADLINQPIDKDFYYPMIAYNLNAYIGFKKSEFWGLSFEPGFIQKGMLRKNSEYNTRTNLNYIQLPILMDYYIIDKFYISIGPELSYMINAKAKSEDNSVDMTNLYDRRMELSGLVGVNYQITDNLDMALRYNHGLTYTLIKSWVGFVGYTADSKEYNQYCQLSLKFKI